MKRYKIYPASVSGGRPVIEILENKNGEWCKYSDVAALESQLREAQEQISEFEAGEVLYRSRIENLESYQRDDRNLLRRAANLAGENMNLKGDIQQLQAENTALRANSLIQEHIINHGSDPKDKEEIVRLIMENAALRADNAAMVNKFRQIHRHIHPHNVPWYSPEIDHICDSVREISHPGDSLLKELEALRGVYDVAEEIVKYEHTNLKKLKDALAAVKAGDQNG